MFPHSSSIPHTCHIYSLPNLVLEARTDFSHLQVALDLRSSYTYSGINATCKPQPLFNRISLITRPLKSLILLDKRLRIPFFPY